MIYLIVGIVIFGVFFYAGYKDGGSSHVVYTQEDRNVDNLNRLYNFDFWREVGGSSKEKTEARKSHQ